MRAQLFVLEGIDFLNTGGSALFIFSHLVKTKFAEVQVSNKSASADTS